MKRLDGRIAIDGRDDVGAERVADRRFGFERVGISLPDQFGGDVGVIEPLADAMHHRSFQRVVMQDRGIDEGGELGLGADDVFGFGAQLRPDRVDLLDRIRALALLVGHDAPDGIGSGFELSRSTDKGGKRLMPAPPEGAVEYHSTRFPWNRAPQDFRMTALRSSFPRKSITALEK